MIPKTRLILHLGIGGLLAAWRLSKRAELQKRTRCNMNPVLESWSRHNKTNLEGWDGLLIDYYGSLPRQVYNYEVVKKFISLLK
jgi:hypothetical protein